MVVAGGLQRGATWGRYVVLERVGEGAMGVVYAAYDPRLDRRVALKLLHPGERTSAEDRQRLHREAQAMARLSHPNVVAVHDVGELEGDLHIAMEYVEGATLGQWVRERPRSWREIVAAYAQAGRGLAAAHAAGIVHRDFKPENALVDRHGRVRVTDFGLARSAGASGGPAPGEGVAPGLSATLTGAVLGTPAYMAPEQFTGHPTDARTDQFGFCVALYEALHGERPFAGEGAEALAFAVTMGKVRPPPRDSRVPPWLRQVLLRGLATDPAQRFPSMDALLAAMARDPAVRRRRWAGAALGVAVVAVAVAAMVAARSRADQICRGGDARMAGVWDDGRRAEVERAFLASRLPYAAEAWRLAQGVLDRYATSWLGMYRDACEATQLRREQSEALLDLRMACLERRRQELSALTDLLAAADAKVIENVAQAVAGQTPVAACADVAALSSGGRLPADPALRRRVEAAQGDLARVKAATDAGKLREALARAPEVVRLARELGHPTTLAEALAAKSYVHQRLEQAPEAEADLMETIPAALAAHHDEALAAAFARLVSVVGVNQSRPEEGRRWAQFAHASLAALGPGHEALEATLINNEGMLASARGDTAEAIRLDERALALRERVLGPAHPTTAASLLNLAADCYAVGDYDRAAALFRRAVEVTEAAVGPSHPQVGQALTGEGAVLLDSGRPSDALRALTRARAILEAAVGADSVMVADALSNQALALLRLERPDEALVAQERALAMYRGALGPRDAYVAAALANLAEIRFRQRDPERALELARQAAAMFEEVAGAEHPSRAAPLLLEARIELDRARADLALAPAERAMELRDAAKVSPRERAEAQLVVARALGALGRDHARALALARSARDLYRWQGRGYEQDVRAAEAWLARNEPR